MSAPFVVPGLHSDEPVIAGQETERSAQSGKPENPTASEAAVT